MKRSEIRKAIERWFDVERYEAIEKLTLQQFYVEVERRILAHKMLLKRDTLPPLNRLLLDDYRNKILRGEILFSGDTSTQGHELARTYAVVPVTRSNAQLYAKSLTLLGTHPETAQRSQSEYLSEYLKESGIKNLSSITVDIFLQEASTEDIIEHLKVLIPQWRKQLKMNDPAVREYRFGKSTLRKIIEYRLIPMMDLIFWGADNNDTKIPLSLISSLLHEDSDKDRDEGMLKATDYPLAMALLTDESYLKSFEDYMMENNYLRDMPIADHVKDDKKKKEAK
ncbi:hypothetical protein R3P88_003735 [Salmonella enterica]|uniref:Uncharacterized protein n=3 Tax=Salmonella enterica TaxID=28901 RepID=A0A743SLU4_SALER|nr:hypothetical protein DOE63_08850 [Salmonella enterica subsp. diarizonae serovar 59:z10:-]EAQ6106284.1 hypothetical protein [Salmonella enterica]ECE0110472.1 hypothetical protein [Salmonella enterica subsp. diarizonae]ECG4566282.1 hypothetical protein [Salmonella enterica subsp. enterica serovar Adelaide]HCM1648923.1 hypothetical protein [Salmonella enterica subsp. diarizonae serovar 48:i:z35]